MFHSLIMKATFIAIHRTDCCNYVRLVKPVCHPAVSSQLFAPEVPSGMHDPLSSSSAAAFGGAEHDDIPPWPTTPHYPGSAIPNLLRPSSVPPTPEKGPAPGIYGKDPQIYGQPEPGLVSPQKTLGSNGVNYGKPEPYLRVRINGLDRNRRDILVKLDAQVKIFPHFVVAFRFKLFFSD